jgi:hypothetical protein
VEHFPAKACPRLDRGWEPVRRKNAIKQQQIEHDPILFERIMLYLRAGSCSAEQKG